MPKREDDGPGFDTEAMTLPTMDRPSVVFAWFMDSIGIEEDVDYTDGTSETYLICNACTERIMSLDDGDTLRVMFNSALAHRC